MSDKLTDNLRMNIGSKADPLEPEELNSNFMKIDESLKDHGVNVKWFGAVGQCQASVGSHLRCLEREPRRNLFLVSALLRSFIKYK